MPLNQRRQAEAARRVMSAGGRTTRERERRRCIRRMLQGSIEAPVPGNVLGKVETRSFIHNKVLIETQNRVVLLALD